MFVLVLIVVFGSRCRLKQSLGFVPLALSSCTHLFEPRRPVRLKLFAPERPRCPLPRSVPVVSKWFLFLLVNVLIQKPRVLAVLNVHARHIPLRIVFPHHLAPLPPLDGRQHVSRVCQLRVGRPLRRRQNYGTRAPRCAASTNHGSRRREDCLGPSWRTLALRQSRRARPESGTMTWWSLASGRTRAPWHKHDPG